MGAAEYILHAGNKKLILCERGITAPHTHSATSRYLLDLTAVVALKECQKICQVICPNACFNSNWVHDLSLASLAAGSDGHSRPDYRVKRC